MKRLGASLFPAFVIAALVSAFLVVTLGGIVRVTGSGLGCPDWPLCHGRIIPPWDLSAWIEYIHRLSAATASLFTGLAVVTAFARYANQRRELALVCLTIPLLIAQIALGALNVILELPPLVTLTHTLVALAFIGTLALAVANTPWFTKLSEALRAALAQRGRARQAIDGRSYRIAFVTLAAATFLTLLVGSAVTRSGASLVCEAFPHCGTAATSTVHEQLQWLQMGHRGAAFVVTALVIWVLVRTWRLPLDVWSSRVLRTWVGVLLLLVVLQASLGVANVVLLLPYWSRVGHLTNAALLFAGVMLLLGVIWRGTSGPTRETVTGDEGATSTKHAPAQSAISPLRRVGQTVLAYIWLMKPNIIVLLLVTTIAAMLAAGGSELSTSLVFWTLLGGFFCAGGANALNSFLDYDIDGQMKRTRWRPLPAGRVDRRVAFVFAVAISIISIGIFALFVNTISAILATIALLYYVVIYSIWLKRRSVHNIVIGGAAGAFPPVIGWTAVTGQIDLAAVAMFLIIFFWTPPHAWALALLAKDDYQRVKIPMLPVVRGEAETRRQILVYTFVLVAVTLLPAGLRVFGVIYLLAALFLGVVFILYAMNLYRAPSAERVRQVYKYSSLYLALFFVALVVDANLQL